MQLQAVVRLHEETKEGWNSCDQTHNHSSELHYIFHSIHRLNVPTSLTMPFALVDSPEGPWADLVSYLYFLEGDLPHVSTVSVTLLLVGRILLYIS